MKKTATNCRAQGSMGINRNASTNLKKSKNSEMVVADFFYAWGEILAHKLESFIENEAAIPNKMEWLNCDSVEDFLIEGK